MPLSDYFYFSDASSFRMVNENQVRDPRYNTLPLDALVDLSDYAQPWQTNDINARLQVFTPYTTDVCGLYDYYTDVHVQDVPITPISPPLLNQPFICANALPDFSSVAVGLYYLKYTYTDENDVVQDIRSSPLDVRTKQPNTLLYEATNTYNDKGTVFVNGDGTLVTFAYRVQAILDEPTTKNTTENYEDQYNELYQESYIPFQNWVNYIGVGLPKGGLPFWYVNKFNFVYSLNNILIDGQPFSSTGQEFKPTRATDQKVKNGFWAINVQPNTSSNTTQYQTGIAPPTTFKVIELSEDYPANSENITISGLFGVGKEIVGISGVNTGQNAVTISVGTSAPVGGVGSNDIATLNIDVPDPYDTTPDKLGFSFDFRHMFTGTRIVYITGITGAVMDLYVRYVDYNAPNYIPPDNSTKFVQNTLYSWIPYLDSSGDTIDGYTFDQCFDITTGLGVAGSEYANCVLAGVGGRPDMTKKLPLGWNRTISGTLGVRTGTPNNLLTQLASQVGLHYHALVNLDTGSTQLSRLAQFITAFFTGGGIARNYALQESGTRANAGSSSNQIDEVGDEVLATDPMDITPDSIQVAYFYYIKP